MDASTKSYLTSHISHKEGTPEYEADVAGIDGRLVTSPLTGKIITLGVLDMEKESAVVYFDTHGVPVEEFSEGHTKYKPMDEAQMLASFWKGALNYNEFITFNGCAFDIPYIILRSGIQKIKVTKNLLSHRSLHAQAFNAKHIDLHDQLTFYGALEQTPDLTLWNRALGSSIDIGDDSLISKLYKEDKFSEIAEYTARNLLATKELYLRWTDFMK